MLLSLGIRDFLLVERLDLELETGLSVLTGETGAGKSILLDALGLALGGRGEASLVRKDATQASVTAAFSIPANHPVRALLAENGLDSSADPLVLRRVIGADGRSRVWIDDQPASVGLARQAAALLVEVHGQFDQHGLLDPATHRNTLDAYLGLHPLASQVQAAWGQWREAQGALETAQANAAQAEREQADLRHAIEELTALSPELGEEATLAERRVKLQQRSKLTAALEGALGELTGADTSAERRIIAASRQLDRLGPPFGDDAQPALTALDRALTELGEAISHLERLADPGDGAEANLEAVEERLFALRAMARKHAVDTDDLPELLSRAQARLALIEDGGASIGRLASAANEARDRYIAIAEKLSADRAKGATRLDRAVMAELGPLKLDRAVFKTRIDRQPESGWGPAGLDTVAFEVATNPGMPPGSLAKIASGGELARFMLALKVVLAASGSVETLVFDEVDSGIGGAVAAAVGDRLAALGRTAQVLVVTHSPQVAARGASHWHVAKQTKAGSVATSVARLDPPGRREEIARMLSGSTITDEARAAADKLLGAA